MAVTRNDVAARAGVSPAVVSYVLNNGPRPVSDAARARVLAAVRDLGYRRDGLARSLRLGRTKTLGLVLPDASNPFFAELARAIEDAAYERGYAVLVCNSADDPQRESRYIQSLAERRIDGMILISADSSQDLRDAIDLSIPVVALDRSPDASPVSTIRSDNERGAWRGAMHLLEHGHRRIDFIGGPDSEVSRARHRGWTTALADAGIPARRARVGSFTFEGGRIAAEWLFEVEDPPTAVLVSSDVQAFGTLRELHRRGVRVPQEVALVSIDGTVAGQYAVPPLTTISQQIVEMGSRAVTHLISESGATIHETLDGSLTIRASCGC
jgi:LacI family transcriptional regulator